MSYANIMASYYNAGLRHWDPSAMATYLGSAAPLGPSQCNFIAYDDEQSVTAKGAYAQQYGLGGVIIWTIAQGYRASQPPGQRDLLLDAVRAAF
jgi:chitinase